MSALVGVASMICQIAWTRTIVLVVGGSAYAFSAVLGVFLAGLGLGAWLASASLARWPGQTIELYVLVSLAVIAALFGSLAMLPVLPGLFLNWFDAEWSGLRGGIFVLQAGSAAALFLLPTTLMGALFPLLLRQMLDQDGSAALATSRVYLANTLGCVAGALAAGLVLIPAIGITPTLVLAIGLFCYALLLGAIRIERPVFRVSACAAMFLSFTIGWYLTPPWNSQLMSAGVSEQARRYVQLEHMSVAEHLKDQYDLLFYRDGPTATVSVSRERWSVPRHLFISTNGKVDGSSWGDMPTQKLSAHLPLLMHPWPETVAVVGMGTGVTAGSATLHDSVEQVSVLEIEPAMVEGARLFAEYNHRVHDNPKSLIRVIDGRFHLSLFEDRYDVIISEPSNPWVAGVASLFTREFYQLGARALKEGGVFAQWIQIYDISPDNLRSVVRSFHEVFPYTYGAVTIVGSDLLLIGSVQPFMIDVEDMRQRLRDPLVSEDLADPAVGVHSVWELLARVWLAPTGIERLADGGRLHRDDWPFLMYEAPLTRYLGGRQQNMQLVADVAGDVDRFLTDGLDSSQQYQWLSAYEAYVPEALRWWVTGLQQGQ